MIPRPPRSTRTDTLFPTRRSSDLDADSDGLHIATLLSALFLKHFPALVANGNIFVAMPPLFRVDVGKQVFYALDEEEKRLLLERIEREKIKGDRKSTRLNSSH